MGRRADNKIRTKLIEKIDSQCFTCDNIMDCNYVPSQCVKTEYYKNFDKSLNLKNARTYDGSISGSSFNSS